MAVTNLYPNLPGHLVEFKDGGLQLTSNNDNTATGKSLLILGTALDGPINEPVKIDATTVSQLFGSELNENGYPNGATLTKYAKQAFKNGFTDVRCMRVTGAQASTTVEKDIAVDTRIETLTSTATTAEGNDAHNDITLENGPVVAGSVSIKTASGASVATENSYSEYDTKLAIRAGAVSKNETLTVSYKYKDISGKITDTFEVEDAGDGVATPYTLTSDKVYVTPKDGLGAYTDTTGLYPVTSGIVITDADSNVLREGTDYTVSGNEVVFDASIIGKMLSIEYYTYTDVDASETVTLNDNGQVVNLVFEPIANSVYVTVNGVKNTDASAITVDATAKTVTLNPGFFKVGDSFTITYSHEVAITSNESMTVRTIYGGSVYNTARFQIMESTDADGNTYKKFIFEKPSSKKYTATEAPLSTTSIACPTVGELKLALKNAALNNVFEIVCDDDDMTTADFPIFEALLSGGKDGIKLEATDTQDTFNNLLFEALAGKRDADGYLIEQGAFQILENYNVDYIYPAGVYADSIQTVNPNSSFHHELALLCAVLTYRTKMTHGFIDVKPNSNTTLVGIQTYVNKLLAYNNDHYMKDDNGDDIVDSEGNKMDIGWYTSVVVGPEPVMVSDTLGTYYGSPAIAYAALNASISPQSAPTNKALPGCKGMKFKFSNKQMNELVGNRFVVFKLKNEGTTTASSIPYVVDGCTAGNAASDYTRLSTVKVVTDVVDQIREVADPFIGEPNTIEQRNALSALISKRLSYLMEQGEIQYYEFEINATIQQVVLGECSIALTLVPPMELRKITTVVALRAAA